MRRVFGLIGMLGLLVLSLGPQPSSALTPEQQACLHDCLGTYHGCSLGCVGDPACQAQCDADYSACRQACLS
jgi:hypothetical protein